MRRAAVHGTPAPRPLRPWQRLVRPSAAGGGAYDDGSGWADVWSMYKDELSAEHAAVLHLVISEQTSAFLAGGGRGIDQVRALHVLNVDSGSDRQNDSCFRRSDVCVLSSVPIELAKT